MAAIPLAATLTRYPAPGLVTLQVLAEPPSQRWRVETLHAHPISVEVEARSGAEARTKAQLRLGVHRSLLEAERI